MSAPDEAQLLAELAAARAELEALRAAKADALAASNRISGRPYDPASDVEGCRQQLLATRHLAPTAIRNWRGWWESHNPITLRVRHALDGFGLVAALRRAVARAPRRVGVAGVVRVDADSDGPSPRPCSTWGVS